MYKLAIGIGFGLLLFCNEAMAACSVPNTLTNGTTADAAEVMGNFTSLAGCAAPLASPTFTGGATFPGSTGITSGGHLLVNTTSDFAPLSAVGNGGGSIGYLRSASTADTFLQFIETGSGSTTMAYFQVNGAAVGSIVSNNFGTTYNTTSDERLKNVHVPQRNYRAAIEKMWVGDFTWTDSGEPGFGIRAQQAYSLYPVAVTKPKTPDGLWQADYGKLAPLALWGVKDLYTKLDGQHVAVVSTQGDVKALRIELAALKVANDNQISAISHLEEQVADLRRKLGIQAAQR